MFVVVKCLDENGTVDVLARMFLGRPSSLLVAMFRLCVPIALVSIVVVTTPLVTMMIPVVLSWSSRIGIPSTKLLIPLNVATVIGGTCSIIGGTPNIVVAGLLEDYDSTLVRSGPCCPLLPLAARCACPPAHRSPDTRPSLPPVCSCAEVLHV